MTHRKMKSRALMGLLLVLAVCLSGCSFSFCGIPLGGREELVFVCSEEDVGKRETGAEREPGEQPEASTEREPGEQPEASTEQEPGEQTESGAEREPAVQPASGASGSGITADGKVNINLATAEELMTLKGVGETRARAIVEYREKNGPFQKIEDIMLIPGIKEGIFSKIKEQIATQ